MYAAMLNHPLAGETDVSALEVCVSGGAALRVEIMHAFEQTFSCQILEAYGVSETSPLASSNRRGRERKPGSIGVRSTASRCASSTTAVPRFPKATSARWRLLHRRLQEGPCHPRGYNVYPREVEEVLYEHPDVRQVAVIGSPHDELGEEVGAAIVLKTGAHSTPDELWDFVKQRIAAYKYPRQVWFVDALPEGPTGKTLKREVKPPDGLASPLHRG